MQTKPPRDPPRTHENRQSREDGAPSAGEGGEQVEGSSRLLGAVAMARPLCKAGSSWSHTGARGATPHPHGAHTRPHGCPTHTLDSGEPPWAGSRTLGRGPFSVCEIVIKMFTTKVKHEAEGLWGETGSVERVRSSPAPQGGAVCGQGGPHVFGADAGTEGRR